MYKREAIKKIVDGVISRVEANCEFNLPPAYSRYASRRLLLEKEQISDQDFALYLSDLKAARWPATEVAEAIETTLHA